MEQVIENTITNYETEKASKKLAENIEESLLKTLSLWHVHENLARSFVDKFKKILKNGK